MCGESEGRFVKESILILANKYPNEIEPTTNMFIQQLAWEFADIGFECNVICPMPINFNIRYVNMPYQTVETTENGNNIQVFRPKYISLGQSGNLLLKERVLFTTKTYELATKKVFNKQKKKPDYIYSYFLCPTSVVASRLGIKYGIPAFMEHGEALYYGNEKYGNEYLKKELKGLKGVIAVSNQNKHYVVDSGIVDERITTVYPNCFREERFHYIDKGIAREHFGWDKDLFIVGYAGSFDERKGILRLQAAVDGLDEVYFACAGNGPLNPDSPKCIWAKPVNHDELPYFYNALDAFVLPTLAEGSCTATAEAIGCGCPIISSNRRFNENLCFEDNSITVDPENIEEISSAIKKLQQNPELRNKMSQGSLRRAENLKQSARMKNIVGFMKKMKGE